MKTCSAVSKSIDLSSSGTSVPRLGVEQRAHGVLLARPHQAEALATVGRCGDLGVEQLAQPRRVEHAVGEDSREELLERGALRSREVWCLQVDLLRLSLIVSSRARGPARRS